MAQLLSCPSCGAPQQFSGYERLIICPFCSSSIIVPPELQTTPPPATFSYDRAAPDLGTFVAQHGADLKTLGNLVRAGQIGQATELYRVVFDVRQGAAAEAVQRLFQGQIIEPFPMFKFGVSKQPPPEGLQISPTYAPVMSSQQATNIAAGVAGTVAATTAGVAGVITATTIGSLVFTGCLTVFILVIVAVAVLVPLYFAFR